MDRPGHVGVIGAGACTDEIFELARKVGEGIARKGWMLICGGLGGVMEGAAKGCSEGGGMTVGILPGAEKGSANPYIRVALPTGLADGRNLLVVRASDILIAIAGSHGTLSEIGLALKAGKPVIGLETWKDIQGITYVSSPQEALETAARLLSLYK